MVQSESLFSLKDINSWRGASHVIHGIDLEVAPQECVAIVGRNGVGKTTLVESIFGMGPRMTGSVWFEGQRIDGLAPNKLMGLGIALVPQGRRLFQSLSVGEHLALAASRAKHPLDLQRIYEMFPVIGDRTAAPAVSLSGGERSMLAIARALVTSPKLIVMDEPTEGLAPLLVTQIGKTLVSLRENGVTLIVVEQNLNLALSVSDRLLIMDRGTIVENFASADVDNTDQIQRLIVLGEA